MKKVSENLILVKIYIKKLEYIVIANNLITEQ